MNEDNEPMSLQDLVLTRLAALGERGRPLNGRQAAIRSRGAVSYDTFYAIMRGDHSGNLTDRVAEGIALALEVPVGQVYDAAGLPRPQGRWHWPERFDRLTLPQRQKLEDMAQMVLDADQAGYDRGRGEREMRN